MPLLPKGNSLDYNPNSIINASKKIRTIALERLKNPVEDPDQTTLSNVRTAGDLRLVFEKLEEMAGTFSSVMLRVQNLEASELLSLRKGRGRKLKGGADPRFTDFHDDDDRNTFATPAPDYRDPEDINFDDREPPATAYQTPRRATEPSKSYQVGRDWTSMIFYLIQIMRRMDMLINSAIKPNVASLTVPQVERLTAFYKMIDEAYDDVITPLSRRTAGMKSAIDPVTGVRRTQSQLPRVASIVSEFGLTEIDTNIIAQNEYGDEILNTFNTERKKLLLDLNVVINAWRQNTPTGQQMEVTEDIEREFTENAIKNDELYKDALGQRGSGRKPRNIKDTMTVTMVGSGRNFYGEKINNSRDIPTIWGRNKDCPTKYLL